MRPVMTVGCFDLLHRGHDRLLSKMRDLADGGPVLVLLHSDLSICELKGRAPMDTWPVRASALVGSGFVDKVFPVPGADPTAVLESVLRAYPGSLYVRGDDMPDFPGRATVEQEGCEVRLLPYTQGVSTSLLRAEAGHL